MITPEQQTAAQGYLKSINYQPPAGGSSDSTTSQPSAWDAIDAQVNKIRQDKAATAPKLGQGVAGDFAGGVVQAIAKPLLKTGGVIESALDQTLGRGINAIKGNGPIPTNSGSETQKVASSPALESKNTSQDVGNIVGTIAPYLTGAGEEETATRVATMLPKLAETLGIKVESLMPKLIEYLAKSTPTAVKNTAIGTAQTGNPEQGAEIGVGGEVLGATGRIVSAAGKGLYKAMSIPTSAVEARALQAYKARVPLLTRISSAIAEDSKAPVTGAETAFNKGLMGTESMIGVQAKKETGKLWNDVISPALKGSEQVVNMPKFFDVAAEEIRSSNPELARQKSLLNALDALREDYMGVEDVPLEDLQKFKEGWAKNVPEKAYKGQPIAGAFNDVKNIISGIARQHIYAAVGPEVKQAYIDYGNLKGLSEWGQKAMTGSKFKGGAGSFVNALKDTVVTPIATIGGRTVYKIGQGMEFIGPPGARYLSDLFNEESPQP